MGDGATPTPTPTPTGDQKFIAMQPESEKQSCVSPLELAHYYTRTAPLTPRVGFSHTEQFSDTNWVSYNSIQF